MSIMDLRTSMMDASGDVVRTVRVMISETGLLEISSEIVLSLSSGSLEESME